MPHDRLSEQESREAFGIWQQEHGDPPLTLWDAWQARGAYDEQLTRLLTCGRCGGPYHLDTSIPSEVWNQIARPEDYWCTRCIDEAVAALGLSELVEAEFYLVGRGIVSRSYTESPADTLDGTVAEMVRVSGERGAAGRLSERALADIRFQVLPKLSSSSADDPFWVRRLLDHIDALAADLAAARAEVEGLKNTIEIQERGKYGRVTTAAELARLTAALEAIDHESAHRAWVHGPWVHRTCSEALRPKEGGASDEQR